MERIESLITAANEISNVSFNDVSNYCLKLEVSPHPHLGSCLTNSSAAVIGEEKNFLEWKRKRIQKLFTTDVYLTYPKMLLEVLNSFNKDLLFSFLQYRTNSDFQIKRNIQNNPFDIDCTRRELLFNLNSKDKVFNWVSNNWAILPDKIWMIKEARINILKGNIIELECTYKSYATLIYNITQNDYYSHTILIPLFLQKTLLLKQNKQMEVTGILKLYFDDKKLLKTMYTNSSIVFI
jgi:hypothetical protein